MGDVKETYLTKYFNKISQITGLSKNDILDLFNSSYHKHSPRISHAELLQYE